MEKILKNILVIFIIILLFWVFFNSIGEYIVDSEKNNNENIEKNENKKIEVKFYSSIDGDTAKFILDKEIIKVRFLGVDTPETPESPRGEGAFWKEASEFTKEKLENAKKIEIEYDENAAKKDKYDRVLAWVWVDNSLLQEELVYNGFAKTYMLQDDYKYSENLRDAQNNAKNKKLKIWSEKVEK